MRLPDLLNQFLRHGLAGFVVPRIVAEHGGVQSPVFVEHGWNLHEIARLGRSRIADVGHHRLQSMAEFVEHRSYFCEAKECRLARRWLGEIFYVVDDRPGAKEAALANEAARPSASALVGPGEKVGIEQGQRRTVGVKDLKHAHIGLVNRNVFALFEGQTVELIRRIENAILEHAIELEERAYL